MKRPTGWRLVLTLVVLIGSVAAYVYRGREALKKDPTAPPNPTVGDVLKKGETDEVIGKMRVSAVLESLPGVGKARAAKIMERLEISPTRRVRGLGANQRKALEAEFSGEKVV